MEVIAAESKLTETERIPEKKDPQLAAETGTYKTLVIGTQIPENLQSKYTGNPEAKSLGINNTERGLQTDSRSPPCKQVLETYQLPLNQLKQLTSLYESSGLQKLMDRVEEAYRSSHPT